MQSGSLGSGSVLGCHGLPIGLFLTCYVFDLVGSKLGERYVNWPAHTRLDQGPEAKIELAGSAGRCHYGFIRIREEGGQLVKRNLLLDRNLGVYLRSLFLWSLLCRSSFLLGLFLCHSLSNLPFGFLMT